MSSEVQAKWMNSLAAASSASSATRLFRKYSTAFTSWLVVRSKVLMAWASALPKSCTMASRRWRAAGLKGFSSGRPASDKAMSQATSTCTRWRMKAASDQ